MTNQDQAVGSPDATQATTQEVEIRRVPRFMPFALTGAAAGLVFALVAWFASGANGQIMGYLIAYGTASGFAAGLVVAVLADYFARRRAKRALALRETVSGAAPDA